MKNVKTIERLDGQRAQSYPQIIIASALSLRINHYLQKRRQMRALIDNRGRFLDPPDDFGSVRRLRYIAVETLLQ